MFDSQATPGSSNSLLVGGLEHVFFSPYIGNLGPIIPTDEVIFFRGVGQPATSGESPHETVKEKGFFGVAQTEYKT
jgi:hypothetical protein